MFKLYYNPGSCSLAAHAALEEAGLAYEVEKIDLTVAANEHPGYRAINPWARVPALATNYGIVTENIAILSFIADLVPERNLLPRPGSLEHVRALEWMALLSSTVHVAFRPLFRPGRLAATAAGQADVAAVGLESLDHTLALLDERVGARPFVLGESFSLVDLYLFVFLAWMQRPALRGKLAPRPNLEAMRARLAQRPSVRRAMIAEGLIIAE
ncbi:MAG: gst [Bradyrhizobium sp.]|nr:gst [Bradyrhizobium sp.]